MSKFIADKIQIAMRRRGQSEDPGQLPQGDAPVHVGIGHGQGHVMIDGSLQKAEDEGFSTDDGLVMAFHITDDPLLHPAAREFMPKGIHIPKFIRSVGTQLPPKIRYAHR